ncbi:MAG: SDR family NAD(P)-dependent oxidoreductase [Arcobacteraceae bacterium]|jgi:short-subunit dehydrogenase|nr:SDR family NAD(P)-dependent oxidoreductase [Arcobacteraceae bacterium]MDY0365323.1 SDR family NAD(P)-dependent oxidoreductase [Arcobacteraceae bacterium]
MKTVVITGSSKGIGKEIADELINYGYNVIKFKSRLEDLASIEAESKEILEKHNIDILINSAGFGMFEPLEELSPQNIDRLISVNLTAPIILANLFLRSLKKTKGHIINISSIEATKHSKFSAAYTASKAGLRDFSLSLFEEVRKSGVRVTSLNPDITKTSFYDNLKFEPSSSKDTYLLPQTLARTIIEILSIDAVVTDITVRPQRLEVKRK